MSTEATYIKITDISEVRVGDIATGTFSRGVTVRGPVDEVTGKGSTTCLSIPLNADPVTLVSGTFTSATRAVPAPSLPTQDGEDDGREPAPLDPSKVAPKDRHPEQLARVRKQVHWATDLKRGDVIVSVEAHNAVTVERDVPAPEPEPEWKPGTTGTAHIVSGDATTKDGRVFRKMRGMVVHRPAPIDDDMFVTVEGELWGLEGEYCKNFVPDEPRPLPTWAEIHNAIAANLPADIDSLRKMTNDIEALLRGESR